MGLNDVNLAVKSPRPISPCTELPSVLLHARFLVVFFLLSAGLLDYPEVNFREVIVMSIVNLRRNWRHFISP